MPTSDDMASKWDIQVLQGRVSTFRGPRDHFVAEVSTARCYERSLDNLQARMQSSPDRVCERYQRLEGSVMPNKRTTERRFLRSQDRYNVCQPPAI